MLIVPRTRLSLLLTNPLPVLYWFDLNLCLSFIRIIYLLIFFFYYSNYFIYVFVCVYACLFCFENNRILSKNGICSQIFIVFSLVVDKICLIKQQQHDKTKTTKMRFIKKSRQIKVRNVDRICGKRDRSEKITHSPLLPSSIPALIVGPSHWA